MKINTTHFPSHESFNVVLTGGPFAGKTSLINALSDMGHFVVSEQAIKVIEQLRKTMGLSTFMNWRNRNPIEFQKLILREQMITEAGLENKSIRFFDRGRYDCFAYLNYYNLSCPASFYRIARQKSFDYDLVINCQTLSTFDEREKTGRTENESDSQKLHDILNQVYTNKNLPVVTLEERPLQLRLTKLLRIIADHQPVLLNLNRSTQMGQL